MLYAAIGGTLLMLLLSVAGLIVILATLPAGAVEDFGILVVTTEPAGATVTVDGGDVSANAPTELPVGLEGEHQVEVTLPGYAAVTQKFSFAGSNVHNMTLVLDKAE
jgi:hypothetical protein